MWNRRELLTTGLAVAATLALAPANAGEDTLAGVTKLIVGFPPGTSLDGIARRYVHHLQGQYSDTMIVENRHGAAGRIAMEQFKRAAPDGKTLLIVPFPLLTLYPHTYQQLKYDPLNDFIPAGTVYQSSIGIAVGPAVPASVTNLAEFIEWAKSRDEPLFFSGNAQGAGPHLMGLQFANRTGIPMEFVPYQGGAPAVNALMAGEIPVVSISMGTLAPLAQSGKVRILASFDPQRNPLYPDVPTLNELGYPDLVENEGGVILLPAKTPQNIVMHLEKSIAAAMESPELQEGMRAQFLNARFQDSATTAANLAQAFERHRKLVADSQFTPME